MTSENGRMNRGRRDYGMWKYMNMELDPSKLPTMQELLDRLREDGGTDRSMAHIREEQMETYQNELVWRYPISEGSAAGGFVLPVREGILWIPYDEIEREDGEILLLQDAHLLSADDCSIMADDFQLYADGLCSMLREAEAICEQLHSDNDELE